MIVFNSIMSDLQPRPTTHRSTIIFLSAVAIFLFLQLFRLPATPILFEGDHFVHLSNSWRMLTGDVAFRDFFLVTFPGTEIYYLTLFKIFGVHQWLLNVTIFCLLLSLSAFGLYFSRKLLTGWAVYLPMTIFLVVGFRNFGVDGSHRFFGVLAVLAAVAVIFSQRSFFRLALAGFFCGLASAFTQPRGFAALTAIVIFLVIEKFYIGQSYANLLKSILSAAIPFGIFVSAILIYFIATAGFETFYFATFVFNVKHYPADQWNNFGAYLREFQSPETYSFFAYLKLTAPILFFYLLVPAVYFIFAAVFSFKRKTIANEKKLQLILINLVGLMLALGVFSAPSVIRLFQISIFALISLVWILQTFISRQAIFAVILSGLSLLGVLYSSQRQTVPVYPLETPTGKIVFLSPEIINRYEWAKNHTQPLDYLYEPHHPSLYSIFKLKNPTPLSWLRPNNFTTDKHVQDIIAGLQKNPPRYIIWNGVWNDDSFKDKPDFQLQPLVDYLKANYHLSDSLNTFKNVKNDPEYIVEIWEKNQ